MLNPNSLWVCYHPLTQHQKIENKVKSLTGPCPFSFKFIETTTTTLRVFCHVNLFMFIEATLYNNIVSLLPRLYLFTFIETKVVYNTVVSFFWCCVNFIHVYRNNDNNNIAQCQCYSSLSKQWYWESFAMLIIFMFIVSNRHLESLYIQLLGVS